MREREPLAIVGIGCRFPGGADTPEAFWSLIASGRDAVTEVPKDRFDLDRLFDPRPATPGKVSTRYGGFLPDIDRIDAEYFGISPREAERLDPQQRLLLEVAQEALDDAGLHRAELAGTSAGVFVGLWLNDYEGRLLEDPNGPDFYMTTGSGRYAAAGRLSYVLGIQGPSLTVDTACSSSLAAFHLACQSVWSGECPLAFVGAANVILSPYITIAYSQSRMLAADGRCKFGDAGADGYVRSEGAAVLVVKPLAAAIRDADRVRALVRGTALNNDGSSSGSLTTPGQGGQEDLLRKAYRAAGVAPAAVQYVEAHGTGTRAGDPVEIGALGAVLGEGRPAGRPFAVGSAKTNIGHTEGAAGLAGLIKAVLSLEHRTIVPSLHFSEPNPAVPWGRLPLYIPTELQPWPEADGPAIAGVSAFGISGTNAHVVLQEAPALLAERAADEDAAHLLPLSAKSEAALRALAQRHREWLAGAGRESKLEDLCYTAGVRRDHHEHRLALAGRSHDDLVASLDAYLSSETRLGLASGLRPAGAVGRVVFVFPGQGSQWLGMGRQLQRARPFRAALEACDLAVRATAGWSILEELHAAPERSRLDDISVVQPLLFAMQVSLAALWRSWGVEPSAVVGHSMGEVAAAHVAGALSLDDAARVICRRSELMKRVSGRGAMAVVELSLDEARETIRGYGSRLSVAVSNSSLSTVVSGDTDAIDELLAELERREVFARRVRVDVASHSPHMDPLMPELEARLDGLRPQPTAVPLFSTVTGLTAAGPELDSTYWVRNLREPVLFANVVRGLARDGHDLFLEASPHPVLVAAIQQELDRAGGSAAALGSTVRDTDEWVSLRGALASLYCRGFEVDWARQHEQPGRVVTLPAYPWQRERHWLGDAPTTVSTERVGARASDVLLGAAVAFADQPDTDIWECRLGPGWPGRVYAHELDGTSWLGASGILELASAAAGARFGAGPLQLEDVELREPILLDDPARTVQVVVAGPADGAAFRIFSRVDGTWTLHVVGRVRRPSPDEPPAPPARSAALDAASTEPGAFVSSVDHEGFYAALERRRLRFSEGARGVVRLVVGTQGASAECGPVGPALPGLGRTGLAPGVLDAVFQVAAAGRVLDGGGVRVPRRIGRIRLSGEPLGDARLDVAWPTGENGPLACAVSSAAGGDAGTWMDGIVTFPLEAGQTATRDAARSLYSVEWHTRPEPAPGSHAAGGWLILGDGDGVGAALAARLSSEGQRVTFASSGPVYRELDDGRLQGRLASAEDLHEIIRRALAVASGLPLAVVQLSGSEASAGAEGAIEACASVVATLQALSRQATASVRLFVVTRGGQAAGDDGQAASLPQAALWGLGRVAAEEHPDLWGGLVDLDPGEARERSAEALTTELRRPQLPGEVALRRGAVLVPRLVPLLAPSAAPVAFRRDAAYLVTGGLGGLGLVVARWMAERGARRIVLLGRRGLPARGAWSSSSERLATDVAARVGAVRELERLGVAVHVEPVDVADEASFTGFLGRYRAEGWPEIRGVFHCAGAIEDALLAELDAQALKIPFAGKVRGAELVDRALGDLDFLVLFSSVGALWGQPGQGAYAAANACLDVLAHTRCRRGQPTLSVNWPVWTGVGFAETEGGRRVSDELRRRGLQGLESEAGLDLLGRLLGCTDAQVAVLPADWARVRESGARVPALLTELVAPAVAAAAAPAGASFRETLAALPVADRRERMETHVQQQLAAVLKLRTDRVDRSRPVRALGLDSLMGLELRKRLEASLELPLSATLVWNHPTVAAMAAHLAARLGVSLDATSSPAEERMPTATAQDPTQVSSLSDEEALRVLMGGEPTP
jgi:myxalamid-type polyketide synthase MxaE and MxaD